MLKYEKKRVLGTGAYGSAFLVELRSDRSKRYVVKEVPIGHLSPRDRDQAQQEADVLSQMSHSNIVTYVERFIEDDKLYIVMEHADGGDLSKTIERRRTQRRPFTEIEVMNIFVQLCLGLKHVHSHKILHRDLKAQNVFLTSNGIVKLGDFGIAKRMDSSIDLARTQIGTPYYISPEICEGKPYGKKSDVWSLGVILYELLTLQVPFQAQSLPALVQKIMYETPSPIPITYSQDMQELVTSMLHKDARQRPSILQILKCSFLQAYISQLLSYTIRKGAGGAEAEAEDEEEDINNPASMVDPPSPAQPPPQFQPPPVNAPQAHNKAQRRLVPVAPGEDDYPSRFESPMPPPYPGRGGPLPREDNDPRSLDYFARLDAARANRLRAEADLYGNDEAQRRLQAAVVIRQQQQQKAEVLRKEAEVEAEQYRREAARRLFLENQRAAWENKCRVGRQLEGQTPSPLAGGEEGNPRLLRRSSSEGSVYGPPPHARCQDNGNYDDMQGQNDQAMRQRAAARFKQRVEDEMRGGGGGRRSPYEQPRDRDSEARIIQLRQAGAMERERAIAKHEQELARAHREAAEERRKLVEKLNMRKQQEVYSSPLMPPVRQSQGSQDMTPPIPRSLSRDSSSSLTSHEEPSPPSQPGPTSAKPRRKGSSTHVAPAPSGGSQPEGCQPPSSQRKKPLAFVVDLGGGGGGAITSEVETPEKIDARREAMKAKLNSRNRGRFQSKQGQPLPPQGNAVKPSTPPCNSINEPGEKVEPLLSSPPLSVDGGQSVVSQIAPLLVPDEARLVAVEEHKGVAQPDRGDSECRIGKEGTPDVALPKDDKVAPVVVDPREDLRREWELMQKRKQQRVIGINQAMAQVANVMSQLQSKGITSNVRNQSLQEAAERDVGMYLEGGRRGRSSARQGASASPTPAPEVVNGGVEGKEEEVVEPESPDVMRLRKGLVSAMCLVEEDEEDS